MTHVAHPPGPHAVLVSNHRRAFVPLGEDSYRVHQKLPENTVCPRCHACVHEGRWQWLAADADVDRVVCPACRRIHDDFPAGYVSVEGDFFAGHRVELLNLVQTHATRATAAHPLRRLMRTEDTPEGVMLTTTDTHLPLELGEELEVAYGGELSYSFSDAHDVLRVYWARSDRPGSRSATPSSALDQPGIGAGQISWRRRSESRIRR